MSNGQRISKELSLSEVVSKTFELYRRDFLKYVILFAVVEAIIGVFTTLVRRAIVLPVLSAHATSQEVLNWAPGFFGALISLIVLTVIVTWVFFPVAFGSAVKLASDQIEKERADLEASVRFTISKLILIWVVGLVAGIIVALGLIALVVPGIILGIMFSLVFPVVMIESPGVLESLGRSRKLVGRRWLKTLALIIVFGIIVGIASVIVGVISGPFGVASTVVSSILSAFYLPVIPIGLTVYYYSNAARIAPPQMSQVPVTPAPIAQTGVKFCPNCGAQLASTATFCAKCGAKQPA
ncbi:MAG: zinc-ribbon domain-containing protein [Nitrososphaerales archaeon]